MAIFAGWMGEFLGTEFAFEEFLFIVGVQMSLEAALSTPSLPTNLTNVALEAPMALNVEIEISLGCVRFGA